jgi:cobalt-zinc-cadmium efflux system protein
MLPAARARHAGRLRHRDLVPLTGPNRLPEYQQPSRSRETDARRLGWALIITTTFMVLEIAGGVLSGSLALLADAGHMLTDSASLGLAWLAARFSLRPDTAAGRGHRAQLWAAFVNALALLFVVAWILWEAAQRLNEPRSIAAGPMLGVALAGLVANLVVLRVLGSGHVANLNVAAARLHVLGDLLGSIAASTAAIVILATGWMPIDPLLSVLVALLILRSAVTLLSQSGRALFANRGSTTQGMPGGSCTADSRIMERPKHGSGERP